MVLKEEQFAGYRNFSILDANQELTRLVRAGNTQFEEYLRLLEEDENIDEQYKVVLHYLLTMNKERLNPCKKENDKDDVTEDKKRLEALNKRKAKEGISKHDDDCNDAEVENLPTTEERLNPCNKENDKDDVTEDKKRSEALNKRKAQEGICKHDDDCNDAEEENDPQFELFLKHLKEHDKSYVLEYEKDGLPVVIKYEEDIASEKEGDLEPESKRKLNSNNIVNEKIPENQHKHDDDCNDAEEENDPQFELFLKHLKEHDKSYALEFEKDGLPVDIKYEGDIASDKDGDPESELKRKLNTVDNIVNEELGGDRNVTISGVNDQKELYRKSLDKNMKQKFELSHQMPHLDNQCKLDLHPASAKNTKSSTLKTSTNEASDACVEKCSASEFRKVIAAKSSMAYKNVEENNLEKEGYGRSDSDVEILDEAACVKKGISNPFVSSKKFSKSMEEDGIGRSNELEEFREGVLNVLKKPYDKEEYTRHIEAIQAGSYFDYHPDLQRKLKKYRYNKKKRLTILRGFFFWLQNLTQEGAFKPWKDRACLVVEPPSP